MPRSVGAVVANEMTMGVYHCTKRCVQRPFLCGQHPVSDSNYDLRKEQIQRHLEFLAGQFRIDGGRIGGQDSLFKSDKVDVSA